VSLNHYSPCLIMPNNRIRLSLVEYYPFVNMDCPRFPTFHVSPGCQRPGIAIEIIKLLTSYLNLTIDVTKVRSVKFSKKEFIFRELDNNETDSSTMFLASNSSLAIKYDFTKELYQVCCFYIYLIKYSRYT
jgi:hypothetical protein